MKITVHADDEAGAVIGVRKAWEKAGELRNAKSPRWRHGIFFTTGNTETVRDVAVYGRFDQVVVRVGQPFPTPEWMKK